MNAATLCMILFLSPAQEQDLKEKVDRLEKELDALKKQVQEQEDPPEREQDTHEDHITPEIAVFLNALYRLDNKDVFTEDGDAIDDTVNLREAQIDFRAEFGSIGEAVLILTAEAEVPGEYEVAVEEGFLVVRSIPGLLDEPPLGLELTVGRMRTAYGRINRLHLHELPQSDRPLIHESIFGEEGSIGNGASLHMIPGSFDGAEIDFTLQALWDDGYSYVANVRAVADLFDKDHQIEAALIASYGPGTTITYSVDVLYRWAETLTVGGQVLYQERDVAGQGHPETPAGYFVYAEVPIAEDWLVGVRWEESEDAEAKHIETNRVTPYVSWEITEDFRVRLSYEGVSSDDPARDELSTVLLEVNVVFGNHHPEH